MGKNTKKRLPELSRRQMLAMVGAIPAVTAVKHPVQQVISSVIDGIISKASAQAATSSSTLPRRFVYLGNPGAPPRWHFDLPLNPYGPDSALVGNAGVMTRFRDTGSSPTAGTPQFATIPITVGTQTFNLPPVWGSSIPTTQGTWVPMSLLLQNMLTMRGINMMADGHILNTVKILLPNASAASITGAVADLSNKPIPAVALQDSVTTQYRSLKGIAENQILLYGSSDPLTMLLSPFNRTQDNVNSTYMSRRQAMSQVIQNAMTTLCAASETAIPNSSGLCVDRTRAEALLTQAVGNLPGIYSTLVNKYNGLMQQCLDPNHPIVGITDKIVRASDYTNTVSTYSPNSAPLFNPDLRNLLVQGQTNVHNLAQAFATAEYIILNGYSDSVNTAIAYTEFINFQTDANGTISTDRWLLDEHSGGVVPSIIINTFRYRAISACLYEFINQLKGANLFNETVIEMGAEFNRSPRTDGLGSDHGWNGHVVSIWSGVIQSPMFVGNTCAENTPGIELYAGSWGLSAPSNADGAQVQLGIGHVTSTIAQLLRVTHPLPNNSPLALENGSGIVATTDLSKNIG